MPDSTSNITTTSSMTPGNGSHMSSIASLPKEERDEALKRLSPEQRTELLFDWRRRARPEQLPPDGNWSIWLYLGGRGAGKTRSGAEYARSLG